MKEILNILPQTIVIIYVTLKIFSKLYRQNEMMLLANRNMSSKGEKLPFRKKHRFAKLTGQFLTMLIIYGIALLILWWGGFFNAILRS